MTAEPIEEAVRTGFVGGDIARELTRRSSGEAQGPTVEDSLTEIAVTVDDIIKLISQGRMRGRYQAAVTIAAAAQQMAERIGRPDYRKGQGVATVGGSKRGFIIDVDRDFIYVLWHPGDDIHQHSKGMPTLRPDDRPTWAH